MNTKKSVTETSCLRLSEEKLNPVPACKGGIMESLRFSQFLKPYDYDRWSRFEWNGLVATQPETQETIPELWVIKKTAYNNYNKFFESFFENMLAGCPLTWKSQWQIEKFCENNPEVLKRYSQGVYFLIHGCHRDNLFVVHVHQNSNVQEFDPRVYTYHLSSSCIDIREREKSPTKCDLHCFILPATWRDPVEEKKSVLDSL
jgi:hypothetical protein